MSPLVEPISLTGDRARFFLPKDVTDRIDWLTGEGDTDAWLVAIDKGRFRLLSDVELKRNVALSDLISRPDSEHSLRNDPTEVFPAEKASLPARALRILVKRHTSGCRMSRPKEMKLFLPRDYDESDWIMIFAAEGFWEIWHRRVFCDSVSTPLPV
jgi:hypothetical protein